jgi:hypothetical protein
VWVDGSIFIGVFYVAPLSVGWEGSQPSRTSARPLQDREHRAVGPRRVTAKGLRTDERLE